MIGHEFVALMYSCTSSNCPTLLCKMIATLDCVHASHYLWLFNADLCNSKYHLEINFENLPPKVNKQDKDLWTQYISLDSKFLVSLMYWHQSHY